MGLLHALHAPSGLHWRLLRRQYITERHNAVLAQTSSLPYSRCQSV